MKLGLDPWGERECNSPDSVFPLCTVKSHPEINSQMGRGQKRVVQKEEKKRVIGSRIS